MIRYLILKELDKQERSLGESVDYVRHILRSSLPAFFKFALFTPLAQHRRKLPPAPYHVARIDARYSAKPAAENSSINFVDPRSST